MISPWRGDSGNLLRRQSHPSDPLFGEKARSIPSYPDLIAEALEDAEVGPHDDSHRGLAEPDCRFRRAEPAQEGASNETGTARWRVTDWPERFTNTPYPSHP
jgi:hypothetical protein